MKIILNLEENLKNLKRIKQKLQENELKEILEALGGYMVASVQQNFEEGGRPAKWQPLKPATIKRKKGPGILIESGNLFQGIAYEIDMKQKEVVIGPTGESLAYAMRHNYGDKGNWPIPRRQYLIIQEEDREYIESFTRAFIY
jgi:phage virion morphogenesis protein